MSGYGRAADQQRSLNAGYRHHLVKPFEVEALKNLLLDAAIEVDHKKRTS
jgi:CheY-like chemotaxis protein